MASRLQKYYREEIIPKLMKEFGYKNIFQAPRLEKITVNMRIGDAKSDKSILDAALTELAKITGQRPVITRAKKSVSNFAIKVGDPVGCRVTLRRERMYEFLDRFVNIALPRIRDFNGLKTTSFDGKGNYSVGIKEQTVFPELDYDDIKRVQGMDIIFTVTSTNKRKTDKDKESLELFKLFGIPFKK